VLKALAVLAEVNVGVQKIKEGEDAIRQAALLGDVEAVRAAMKEVREGEAIAERAGGGQKGKK